ncbi:MAG: thermonuclease family protein [Rickettsiales bacterium]|jgi:endonuclease YncB( thermonuclease family)|nr:thermonuclease family protein [Rickettsiales bacterium]
MKLVKRFLRKIKALRFSRASFSYSLILLLSCFGGFAAKAESLRADVDYIFDGDTFSAKVALENGAKISVRVRIRNIDAPEMSGECESEIELANLAKARLGALIPKGTIVELDKIKDDKYLGRIDALVAEGGRDIGKIMIDGKLARPYNGGKRQPWCKIDNRE